MNRVEKMPTMFNDLLRPFNDWFEGPIGVTGRVSSMPAANVNETDKAYVVNLAAPGLSKDDFKIDVTGDMLTVSSEKEESSERDEKEYSRREYSYTSFSRSFNLPQEVDKDQIGATYDAGVLRLTLPKSEGAKKQGVKQIPVK